MKFVIIHIVLFLGLMNSANEPLFETHFIGMNKNEIVQTVKEKHRLFKLNTTTVNSSFNYLKYEDRINEITVLFFLSDEDKCEAVRIMSDYSNINDIILQLDEYYTKEDASTWAYTVKSAEYKVTLEEGDWFFTVSVKEK